MDSIDYGQIFDAVMLIIGVGVVMALGLCIALLVK
jgi:hypothetical protein